MRYKEGDIIWFKKHPSGFAYKKLEPVTKIKLGKHPKVISEHVLKWVKYY